MVMMMCMLLCTHTGPQVHPQAHRCLVVRAYDHQRQTNAHNSEFFTLDSPSTLHPTSIRLKRVARCRSNRAL